MGDFQATDEQAYAVDRYGQGGHMRIIAYAGAGKTSTLSLMTHAQPNRRGVYVAFNRAIATEARGKFPSHIQASTAHSLAFRSVLMHGFDETRLAKPLNGRSMHADGKFIVPLAAGLTQDILRQVVIGTLRSFCQSADRSILEEHVTRPRRVDRQDWPELREIAVQAATRLWELMTDPRKDMPLGHDGYLKLWQLNDPVLFGDVVLVDEAQDLNPVLVDVVARQQMQIVSVGDSHQQIYAWRGAVDALEMLPGAEVRLTQSFRFGSNIARLANGLLRTMGETVPLRGNGRTDDWVGAGDAEPDVAICRTNSAVIGRVASLLERNTPVCVPGGVMELLMTIEDAERLKQHQPARTADLFGFTSWTQVLEYVETDEGEDLVTFVNLVNKFGTDDLKRILGAVLPSPRAGVVSVATGHKAKGLEWDTVELDSDFYKDPEYEIPMEERRLFYVAATRAREILDVSPELVRCYTR